MSSALKNITRLLVMLTVLGSSVLSQDYHIVNYSIEDGLAQSQVFTIYQDSRGFIWFGTNGGGASRFDGTSFHNISVKDGIIGDEITFITESTDGVLWLSTFDGISLIKGRTIENVSSPNFTRINKIQEADSGVFWLADDINGLFKLENSVIDQYIDSDGLLSNKILDLLIDRDGRLWIATSKGVNYISGDSIFSLSSKEGLFEDYSSSLMEDKHGNIWIAHRNGLTQIDSNGKYTKYDLSTDDIYDIYQDSYGFIWVAAESKLLKSSDYLFKEVKVGEDLSNTAFLSVYEDNEKNIWIATDGEGVFKLNPTNFTHFNLKDGLPSNVVWTIHEDQYRNIWFGTTNGLAVSRNGSFQVITVVNGLADNQIFSIDRDGQNRMWIGTYQGLSLFDGNRFRNFSTVNGLPDNVILKLFVDGSNKVWAGSFAGLSQFNGKGFTKIEKEEFNTQIYNIFEDNFNNIWICTENNGVYEYAENEWREFKFPEKFEDRKIWYIIQDSRNNYWFGHWGKGLLFYDVSNKDFREISSGEGLINDNIASLIIDDLEHLWVGTNRGVSRIDLNEFYENGEIKIRNYDKNNGFIGIECNQNSVYKDRKGNIWFGTNKGVTRYNPFEEFDEVNIIEPKTHITGIKLFYINQDFSGYSDSTDEEFSLPVNLELPNSQNHLTFDFIALSFKDPSKIRYRYRMLGSETDWSPPQKNNQATYSNLSPGDYTFEVIACNSDGIWNSAPAAFNFTILKPFWTQWWFGFLVAGGLVMIIFGYVAIRTRNLEKQKAELAKEVKLRTRELSEEKNKVEEINMKLEDANSDLERTNLELGQKNLQLEKLSIVARETDNSIYIADEKGEIEWMNACAIRTSGYSLEDLKRERGKSLADVSFNPKMNDILEECVRDKKSVVYEVINKTRNGSEYWSSSTVTPIFDENGSIHKYVVVETDITYRKKIEHELEEANLNLENRVKERTKELSDTNILLRQEIIKREEVEHELRMAKEKAEKSDKLKSEFLAQMSHEIRTPVNTILNYSSLFEEELKGKLDEDLKSGFDMISRAGDRIIRTVDLILNMAEVQTGSYEYRPQPLNLYYDICVDIQSVYGLIAQRKGIEFKIIKNTQNTEVMGDEYSTSQIFYHLIDNAVKYTREGKVEIELNRNESGKMTAVIRDTGIGIAEEYLPRIFEPFSQEEQGYTRHYEGNGLGMALVKEYSRINNIEIDIQSEKGRGTAVQLTFPS